MGHTPLSGESPHPRMLGARRELTRVEPLFEPRALLPLHTHSPSGLMSGLEEPLRVFSPVSPRQCPRGILCLAVF